jgi:hypothetical protein
MRGISRGLATIIGPANRAASSLRRPRWRTAHRSAAVAGERDAAEGQSRAAHGVHGDEVSA